MSKIELSDFQRQQVLDKQLEKALAGSEALLIHLGKAYLDQAEKHHLQVEALPFTEMTIEQIEARLAQRAEEAADEKLCEGLAIAFTESDRQREDVSVPSVAIPAPVPRKRGRPKKS